MHGSFSNQLILGNCDIANTRIPLRGDTTGFNVKWQGISGTSKDYELTFDTSSCKFKDNIQPFLSGIEELLKLNPVSYNPKDQPEYKDVGFIAEELHNSELYEFVLYDGENQPLSLKYDRIPLLTVNAIKELHQENQILKQKIEDIESKLNSLLQK